MGTTPLGTGGNKQSKHTGHHHHGEDEDDPDPTNGLIIPTRPAVPPTPDWGEWFAGGLEVDAGVLTTTIGAVTLGTLLVGEHSVGIAATPETFGLSEFMAIIHTPAVIGIGGSIMAVGVGFVIDGAKHMWNSGVLQWGYGKLSTPFQ